jgi:hypothetical protein
VIDALASQESSDNGGLFVMKLGWNQPIDALANDFVGVITEHAACAFVPTANDAIERLADDRVIGRLYDCCKPRFRVSRESASGRLPSAFRGVCGIVRHVG